MGVSHCRTAGVGKGFYSELANSTGALQIWPEHRYYAQEQPYLPKDNFEHLNIEQALVDHIELVLHVQKLLSMDRNPVIAIGGSYSKQALHNTAVSCSLFCSACMCIS